MGSNDSTGHLPETDVLPSLAGGGRLLRNLSQRSVAQSTRSVLSAFERELPQEARHHELELPRGSNGFGSARVAGRVLKPPPGSVGGQQRVARRMRLYDVTVEPNARVKTMKEVLRETAKPLSAVELDAERVLNGDILLGELVDQRFLFRRERARHFHVDSRFPVLVTPRLVPSWRSSVRSGHTDATNSVDSIDFPNDASTTLTRPTVSYCRKRRTKWEDPEVGLWRVPGMSEAAQLLCDRRPVLHEDFYDAQQQLQRQESLDSKRRWLGEATILPTSMREARESCNSAQLLLESQTATMRERGRAFNEDLKERYEARRLLFQKAGLKESGFERSIRQRALAKVDAPPPASAAVEVLQPSRFRASVTRWVAASLEGHHSAGLVQT